jgi:diaminopimelate epimerase
MKARVDRLNIDFHKYHGTSNDFIIIDNRMSVVSLDSYQISSLCNRRTGIGADGVMLLEQEEEDGFDFRMVYYNSDGTQSMCGNGGRCIAQYAFDRGLRPTGGGAVGGCVLFRFTAVDGPHCAEVDPAAGLVRLALCDVGGVEYCPASGQAAAFCVVDTGSPHYVVLPPAAGQDQGEAPALAALNVVKLGREIRHSPRFAAKGINVNFLEVEGAGAPPSESVLGIRTFERGVEDETFSCGTGCAAAAIAHVHRLLVDAAGVGAGDGAFVVRMRARGGDLTIRLRAHAAEEGGGDFSYSDVWLEGPAVFSFHGSVLL